MTVFLRNLAAGIDAVTMLVGADGLYATDAAWTYLEELNTSANKLSYAVEDAINRQLEQRAQ